jgi:hypothetical protein
MTPCDGIMTVNKHRIYGYKTPSNGYKDTSEKNRGKNAEKSAVFSAKKRENRIKTVYFFLPDAKVKHKTA